MKVGYARVSTDKQSLDLQKDALSSAGCEQIYEDVISGGRDIRPGLTKCLEFLRDGDTLVVYKLDRLGRSIRHLVVTIDDLQRRGVGFESLQEKIDDTPTGRLLLGMFGTIAEFERNLIRERTLSGLAAARARGRRGGRPRKLTADQRAAVVAMAQDKSLAVGRICQAFGISKGTYYSIMKEAQQPRSSG